MGVHEKLLGLDKELRELEIVQSSERQRIPSGEIMPSLTNKSSLLMALFLLYPSLITFLVGLIPWGTQFSMTIQLDSMIPRFLFTIDILKTLLVMLGGFILTSISFYVLSKKISLKIKFHELCIFYFFYSPLWVLLQALGLFQVFVFKKTEALNWRL